MKIHEYNEMMAYLTRPAMAYGGRIGFFKAGLVTQKGNKNFNRWKVDHFNDGKTAYFDSEELANEAIEARMEETGRLDSKALTRKYKKDLEEFGYKTWDETPKDVRIKIRSRQYYDYEKKGWPEIKEKTIKLLKEKKPINPRTGLPYTVEEYIKLTDGQKIKLTNRMKDIKRTDQPVMVKGYRPQKEGNRLLNYMRLAAEKQEGLPVKDRTYINVFEGDKFVGTKDVKNNKLFTHVDYDLSKKGAKKGTVITQHPDMKNFNIFFKAAKKFKYDTPDKLLGSYFKKYERVPTYNEIYNFFTISRDAPLKSFDQHNALTLQHQDLMKINPTKNFQLLTRLKNIEAYNILQKFKKGEISEARANYDLKKIGAAQEGLGLSPDKITAEKGLRTAKKEAIKLFKDAHKANPEIVAQMTKFLKIAETAKGPGKIKALSALLTLGGAGFVTALGFSPTEVQAAEPGQMPQGSPGQLSEDEEGLSLQDKAAIGTVAVAGAKPALQGTKWIGKKALQALGSVPAALSFFTMTVRDGMKKGKSFQDAVIEAESGIELLYPNLARKAGFGMKILNPIAKRLTPWGWSIAGAGVAEDVFTKSQPGMLQGKFDPEKADQVFPALIEGYEKKWMGKDESPYMDYSDAMLKMKDPDDLKATYIRNQMTEDQLLAPLKRYIQNLNQGGRAGFDGGGSPLQRLRQEIVDSMRPYAPGDVTEEQLQLIVKDITLDMTAEQAQASAKANFIKLFGMAKGGRVGFATGGDGMKQYGFTPGLDMQKKFEAVRRAWKKLPSRTRKRIGFQNFLEIFAKENFATGGRVGFDKGSKPKSPGRRAFIKGVTALAAIPIVGRFFKLGKVLERAQPYTGPAIEKIKGMPEWFPSLVKKLWNEGEDVTKQVSWKERQIVKRGTLEGGDEVDMIYDLDTGDVSIDVKPGKGSYETTSGAYNKEYGLDYKKGQADEMTKGKPPDEFSVGELEPRVMGPDDVELDGTMTTVDDAMSDLTELEAFAKNKTTTQIHKKKGTKPKDVFPDYDYDPIDDY